MEDGLSSPYLQKVSVTRGNKTTIGQHEVQFNMRLLQLPWIQTPACPNFKADSLW